MSKGAKIKIFAIIGIIVLLGAGALAIYLWGGSEPTLETEEVFYKGDVSKINKTDEQKEKLVVGSTRIPLDTEPYLHETEIGYAVNKLVYEPLVDVKTDGTIEPVLAKSITFSDDGLTASVTLTEAKFSDGSKVTAADVVSSYNRLLAASSTYYNADIGEAVTGYYDYIAGKTESISGIRAINDTVIEFSFEKLTAKNVYVLDVPVVKSGSKGYFLGSGEFAVDEIKPSLSMTLTRSESARSDKYGYKKILFKSVSTDELDKAIKAFEMDVFLTNTSSMLDIIKDSGYHNVYRLRDNYYSYIGFNLSTELGKNENLRKAVAYAIDRTTVASSYYQDYLTSLGTVSVAKSTNSFESKYPLDAAKSSEYLDKALKELASSATTNTVDGTSLTLNYLCQSDSYSNGFYLSMQQALLSAKINLTQTSVYETEYVQTLAAMDGFDVYHKINFENTPIEVIEGIVIQDSDINALYQAMLKENYHEDYKQLFDSIEEFVDSRCLLIPTFCEDYYAAVSADCDKDLILDMISP